MNRLKLSITLLLLCMLVFSSNAQRNIDFVNPMVGTKSMGHTFPGACAPFGLVQLSPDTEMIPHNIDGVYQSDAYRYCAGYQYDDKTIVGFSHTHFNGTGHSDLGDILIMPMTGEVKLDMGTADNPESGYRSRFNHDQEKAGVGYYSVMLDDYGILAELTASERVGVHRYTFPEGTGTGHIVLDLDYGIYYYDGKTVMANLKVEDPYTLTGYRITRGWSRMNYTHFAVKFSKPIVNYGCRNKEKVKYNGFWRKFNMTDNFPEMFGTRLTAFFDFDFSDGKPLEIQVALSPVDCLGAMKNLEVETATKSFDEVRMQTQQKWEKELSCINMDADDDTKAVFYTALYHTMINPSVYQDVDGRYRGIDHNIHQAEEGQVNYTVFSVWDTFRAQHPLMNLIKPARSEQFVNSMLHHYQQSVHKALPVWSHMGNENWCMIGYHSVSVVGDAIVKGLNIDKELGLEACVNSSNLDYYDGIGEYKKLGFVPLEKSGSAASVTLEYAYDDWVISQLGDQLGDKEVADMYAKRALNYQNIFDPSLGFARPKLQDGTFKKEFDLLDTHGQGFIEGNTWNYSFYVPHDVNGLITRMGGEKQFVRRLDSLFTMHLPAKYFENTEDINEEGLMGNYVHGNEPSHHVPYLYRWTNEPWKTESRLHSIMKQMYKNKIDGLSGNDDCGQMSAWYIFSSMGFYPVCPGSDQYVIGSPLVKEAVVQLENGKTFTVKAQNYGDKNIYVKSIKLNGIPYTKSFITHSDIVNGGELVFEMSNKPNRKSSSYQKPYSFTR
ncbi:GH92 family glycosyl hydrolase [Proteiniphilum sp.]|uniref:GH92 family glycosyl hydrolase n=1 Tax=Proteiniphilum sp. TaxID=1926877 RepID=UPI002B2012DC|nr:GH92 family glycosyl hydrolase [Proteiniphilum sp.]MEA4918771.1 GH92 family glycosyl hydrolase [Proteiniphilum sp.]